MSGHPQYNYPLFDRAAEWLRDQGYDVASPAEMDDPETRAAALASPDGNAKGWNQTETWGDFLSRDVKLIADELNGMFLLPGWENSRGARLEAFVAINLEYPIYTINIDPNDGTLSINEDEDDFSIMQAIASNSLIQGDTERYRS